MTWVALLLLRVVTGDLLIGHGAQKLFGAFGGKGPDATGQTFEKMGLRPGREWAQVGGAAEITGGAVTALGLLSPVGPIIATAPMVVAWRKAHRDKPIWVPVARGRRSSSPSAISLRRRTLAPIF